MPAPQTYFVGVVAYGGGVVVAPCDVAFLNEVEHCNVIGLLPGLFDLGKQGDPRHAREGTGSDHNAFVQGPSGLWYVRAHDFGGPKATRQLLNEFWNEQYRLRNPRVYPFGYTNSADPPPHGLTIWYSPGLTRQGTDGDHEHESVNRANTTTIGRAAWCPALDDRSPWGLEAWLRNRLGLAPATSTESLIPPATSEEDDMPTAILKPGESATVPVPVTASGKSVLWLSTDNATRTRDDVSRADVRVAIELAPPRRWVDYTMKGQKFETSIGLGNTALAELGQGVQGVSVVNRSPLTVTVVVAAKPKA